MWQELGVVGDQRFHYHDEVVRVERGGSSLSICTDPRRLEKQMVALSPADAKLTKEFVRLIAGRDMGGAMSLKPAEMASPLDALKMLAAVLPAMGTMLKYSKVTIQEFAQRFQDPLLRDAVRFIADLPGWPMPRFPMLALNSFLKSGVLESGAPLGGSQGVVFRMAEIYQRLGGEIHYKSRVVDLIVENDRAVGIRLEDGTEHRADLVVWAGDGHTVIYDLLGGRYLDDQVRSMYSDWTPIVSPVQVMFGVARDLSKEPHCMVFEAENPICIAGEERRWLSFRHGCFDPSMAPPGKSVAEVWCATPYVYWEELARDRVRYREEKKRIADFTIDELDVRWPGFSSQIEVVDVPTPATYLRYTGNWQGSPEGWCVTPENLMVQTMLRSLPGLSGFHMVGQWTVRYAGAPMAALSGRQLIQLLCKRDGRPFVSSTA
jgi:phytoene dehydrogenase-like protein